MWNSISKFFGLIKEDEDDDDDDGSSSVDRRINRTVPVDDIDKPESREFDGVVTSLHTAYGLIDNEVFFTREVVFGGAMPVVGDRVHVTASRKHRVGGWKADQVRKITAVDSWDVGECWTDENPSELNAANENNVSEAVSEARAKKMREKQEMDRILLEDKNGVCVTDSLNFGQIEIGKSRSMKVDIRNDGEAKQVLCGWSLTSHQFDIGLAKLQEIDLKESSRKVQEAMPMTIEPGKTVVVTVLCHSKFLGREQQWLIFEFDGFTIGRQVEVTVIDIIQFDLQPSTPYQRINSADRYQSSQKRPAGSNWVVPGQRPMRSGGFMRVPKRLQLYPVPDDLRHCVVNERDVTRILPCLNQLLSASNYAVRFSGLLHLEEIQQEIDIREFDLQQASLRVDGEFLALKIPGLAEGRPSLIVGDRVILSEPDANVVGAPSYEGIVHEISKDEVFLKFSEDFHSNFSEKQFTVVFTFNRSTLRRCHLAVEFASKFKEEILFPVRLNMKPSQIGGLGLSSADKQTACVEKVIATAGRKHCPTRPTSSGVASAHKFFNPLLNSRQRAAVLRILHGQGRPTPYIIFGPPGTGKTITIVEAMLQVRHHIPNSRILACTPSNSAADLLTERLHQSGLIHPSDMVRLNAFQRSGENVPECVKSYCSIAEDVDFKSKYIVLCTCSTAGYLYGLELPPGHFTHVFVDESGQATEPECMIPVGLVASSNGQIVLAGDPQQLGPVLRSDLAKDFGLQTSYLERLINMPLYARNESRFADHGSYDPFLVTKLVENYRSHPALISLSSDIFYHGELVSSSDKDLVECLCSWESLPNKNSFPLLFHGIRGEDLREGNSPSWFNPQEAVQVMKYLMNIVHNGFYRLSYDDIGIITPYRKQVEKIRLLIDKLGMEKVKVGSVEEFQGQERLVMIISTVRSSESLVSVDLRYTLGFLSNPKRFNVAITRAHALLIIIGNPHVLNQDLYWSSLIQYCASNGAYVGCDLPTFGFQIAPTLDVKPIAENSSTNNGTGDSSLPINGDSDSNLPCGEETTGLNGEGDADNTPNGVQIIDLPTGLLKDPVPDLSNDTDIPTASHSEILTKIAGNNVNNAFSENLTFVPDLARRISEDLKIVDTNLIEFGGMSKSSFGANEDSSRLLEYLNQNIHPTRLLSSEPEESGSCSSDNTVERQRYLSTDVSFNSAIADVDVFSIHGNANESNNGIRRNLGESNDHLDDVPASVELDSSSTFSSDLISVCNVDESPLALLAVSDDVAEDGKGSGIVFDASLLTQESEGTESRITEEGRNLDGKFLDVESCLGNEIYELAVNGIPSEHDRYHLETEITNKFVHGQVGCVEELASTAKCVLQGSSVVIGKGVDSTDGEAALSSPTDYSAVESLTSSNDTEPANFFDKKESKAVVGAKAFNSGETKALSSDVSADAVLTSQDKVMECEIEENKSRVGFVSRGAGSRGGACFTYRGGAGFASHGGAGFTSRGGAGFTSRENDSGISSNSVNAAFLGDNHQNSQFSLKPEFNSRGRSSRRGGQQGFSRWPSDSRENQEHGKPYRKMFHTFQNDDSNCSTSDGSNWSGGRSHPRPPRGLFARKLQCAGQKLKKRFHQEIPDVDAVQACAQKYERERVFGKFESALQAPDDEVNRPISREGEEQEEIPTGNVTQDFPRDTSSVPLPAFDDNQNAPPCDEELTSSIDRDDQSTSGRATLPPGQSAEECSVQPHVGRGIQSHDRQGVQRPYGFVSKSFGRGEEEVPLEGEELDRKIIRQIEYYFGDLNLMKDKFLQDQIAQDPDGWVKLSVIITFQRMKALSTYFPVIVGALQKSTANIVEVNEDGTKIRRSHLRPFVEDTDAWIEDLKKRSVVIQKYPASETLDRMQAFFEEFGDVAHIERGICKRSYFRRTRGIELVDLIIFQHLNSVRNIAKTRYTTMKRMGLWLSFGDDFTDECIQYFFAKRIKDIPKHRLEPVGSRGGPNQDRRGDNAVNPTAAEQKEGQQEEGERQEQQGAEQQEKEQPGGIENINDTQIDENAIDFRRTSSTSSQIDTELAAKSSTPNDRTGEETKDAGSRVIDRLLKSIDNMSFKKRTVWLPGEEKEAASSDYSCWSSLESSPDRSKTTSSDRKDNRPHKQPWRLPPVDDPSSYMPGLSLTTRRSRRRVQCFAPSARTENVSGNSSDNELPEQSPVQKPGQSEVIWFNYVNMNALPNIAADRPANRGLESTADVNIMNANIVSDVPDASLPVYDVAPQEDFSFSSNRSLQQMEDDIIIESSFEEIIESDNEESVPPGSDRKLDNEMDSQMNVDNWS